jgi:hypothetical protein
MGQKSTQQAFACPLPQLAAGGTPATVIFAGMLAEDIKVRGIPSEAESAAVSRVLIEALPRTHASRFSRLVRVVIGKRQDIENLKKGRQLGVPVAVNIEEVRA